MRLPNTEWWIQGKKTHVVNRHEGRHAALDIGLLERVWATFYPDLLLIRQKRVGTKTEEVVWSVWGREETKEHLPVPVSLYQFFSTFYYFLFLWQVFGSLFFILLVVIKCDKVTPQRGVQSRWSAREWLRWAARHSRVEGSVGRGNFIGLVVAHQ